MKKNTNRCLSLMLALALALTLPGGLSLPAKAEGAASSITGNDFASITLHQGSADGAVVATLAGTGATPTQAPVLTPNTDYYLVATITKSGAGTDYVGLQVGNGAAPNGINVINPPNGTQTAVGDFNSNAFDYMLARSDAADFRYGSSQNASTNAITNGVTAYSISDGTWMWRVKEAVQDGGEFSFAIGFKLDPAYWSGETSIGGALTLTYGAADQAGKTSAVAADTKDTLVLGIAVSTTKTYSASLTTSSTAGPDSYSPYCSISIASLLKSSQAPVGQAYTSIGLDISHPKGSTLDGVFFSSARTTVNGTYGAVTLGTSAPDPDDSGRLVTHVDIGPGLKPDSSFYFNYRMYFDDTFSPGDKPQVTLKACTVACADGAVCSSADAGNPIAITGRSTTFTILDLSADKTTVSAISRYMDTDGLGGTYNWNIGRAAGELLSYKELLNTASISNTNAARTPYKKTFRASYNTTAASANITMITIPVGCAAQDSSGGITWPTGITVNWEGKTAAGAAVSGTKTFAAADIFACGVNFKGVRLTTSDADIAAAGAVTFTRASADIGYLAANSYSNGWSVSNEWGSACPGAWGCFTDGNVGTVVKSYFECYNTSSSDPVNNQNATAYTEASSVPAPMFYGAVVTGKDNRSVTAGDSITVSGFLRPASFRNTSARTAPLSYKTDDGADSVTFDNNSNTTVVVDPVIILKLPAGITYSDLTVTKAVNNSVSGQSAYNLAVSNISYLNTVTSGEYAGWSLYRISFPKDTIWGYMTDSREYTGAFLKITFNTAKSLATRTYSLDDLINVTCANRLAACDYMNSSSYTVTKRDVFGINGGRQLSGVTPPGSSKQRTFGVQQMAEVIASNSAALTSVGGTAVASPTFRTYAATDPNSITFLGTTSTGQFRVELSNPSTTEAAADFKMLIPIPKKNQNLGSVFMDGAQSFDMTLSPDGDSFAAGDNAEFACSYVKITSGAAGNTSMSGVTYEAAADASAADAILVSRASYPAGARNTLLFDFSITSGGTVTTGARNIWRDAFCYTAGGNAQYKTGSYVAAEVAASTITGTVWNDENGNGLRDNGEAAVPGVPVTATDTQGRVLNTATAADGTYSFTLVRGENVAVVFSVPSGSALRYNVGAPNTIPTGCVGSTVIPASDGKSASRTVDCTADQTVSAAMAQSYTLSYNRNTKSAVSPNLVSEPTGSVPLPAEYASGTAAAVSAPTNDMACTGYRFAGWNTAADGSGTAYKAGDAITMTADATLYAQWQVQSYTVTFDLNGGTPGTVWFESKSVTFGKPFNAADAGGNTWPSNPAKDGWRFVTWETDDKSKAPGQSTYYSGGSTYSIEGDTVLRAVYGRLSQNEVSESTKVGAASTQAAPLCDLSKLVTVVNDRSGAAVTYTCTKVNDAAYNASSNTVPGMTLDKNGKIYGTPTALGVYTLVYLVHSAGSGDYTGLTVTLTVAANPLTLAVSANPASVLLTGSPNTAGTTVTAAVGGILAGFTGKVTLTAAKDGQTETIAAGLTPDADGAVTAVWTPGDDAAGSWTITAALSDFDENVYTADGSGASAAVIVKGADTKSYTIRFSGNAADAAGTMADEPMVVGTAAKLAANAFSRAGYAFAGWNTEALPTAETPGTAYADGQTAVDLAVENGAEVTLYAQWSELSAVIRYSSSDTAMGSVSPASETVAAATGTAGGATASANPGYRFVKWTNASGVTVGTEAAFAPAKTGGLNAAAGYTANFAANTYTITFALQGGTQGITDMTVTYGQTCGSLPTPVRKGFVFEGWYPSADGGTQVTASTRYLTAGNSTVYARWTEKGGYTVKYDTAGGTAAADMTGVTWTQTGLLPADDPARTGYTLAGWKFGAADVNDSTAYSALAGSDGVMSVLLTAQWTPEPTVLTFVTGVAGLTAENRDSHFGEIYGDLPALSRTGYTLDGWFTDPAYTTRVSPTDKVSVTGTQTLYARWTAIRYAIRYTLGEDGGFPAGVAVPDGYTVEEAVTIPAPSRAGYVFSGWSGTDLSQSSMSVFIAKGSTGDRSYTAGWEPLKDIPYTVEHYKVSSDGTAAALADSETFSGTTGETAEAAAKPYEGYTYQPAYDHSGRKTAASGAIAGDGSLVLKLYYTPNSCTVTYKPGDHGTFTEADCSTYYGDNTPDAPDTTGGTGYSFVAWNPTRTAAVTGDAVYTAVWSANAYTAHFDSNGGDAGSAMPNESFSYGTAQALTGNSLTRRGYTFAGWNTQAGGGGSAYADGASVSNLTAEAGGVVTLYAQWTEADAAIGYASADSAMGSVSRPSETVGAVTGSAVGSAAAAKANYHFVNWTDENGNVVSQEASFAPEQRGGAYDTATYTAHFAPDAFTLTFDANGHGTAPDAVQVAWGATAAAPAAPTEAGYTFGGWYREPACTTAWDFAVNTMPAGAVTLYARWTAVPISRDDSFDSDPSVPVIVDDVAYSIGERTTSGGTTTVTVKQSALEEQLANADKDVIVPVKNTAADAAAAVLVVKNVEDMAKKRMTLSVAADGVTYEMRAAAMDTAEVLSELGAADSSKVPVTVTIRQLGSGAVTVKDGALVLPPVQFTVTAAYNGKTAEVTLFDKYVGRIVAVPAGTDAGKITTAVVLEANGSERHVPTDVYRGADGAWYARINSLTDSTYALIYNEQSFSDASGKWYKDVVTEMASRKILEGVGGGLFEGDRSITRAEFAAVIIRALGLPQTGSTAAFSDVDASAWYYGAVGKAYEYGIIRGYEDGTFAPNTSITREEAMAMMQRAAGIAEYAGTAGTLDGFSDAADVDAWAESAVKFNVGSGLIQGSDGMLNPKISITRAETAVVVLRLLQKSGLVDVRSAT